MSELVQISQHSGEIRRVPYGAVPVIELPLEPRQYVASVELRKAAWMPSEVERQTVDWTWTAYVVTPLGAAVG